MLENVNSYKNKIAMHWTTAEGGKVNKEAEDSKGRFCGAHILTRRSFLFDFYWLGDYGGSASSILVIFVLVPAALLPNIYKHFSLFFFDGIIKRVSSSSNQVFIN